jgi:MFS family permease
VLGYSALEIGLAFVPLALSACAGGLIAPRIIASTGPRRTAAVSMAVTAAAFAFLSRAPEQNGYVPVLLPVFLIAGFTFAAAFVPLVSHSITGVRDGEKGLASGLVNTSTHLGGAIVLASAAAGRTSTLDGAGDSPAAALVSGFSLASLIAAALLMLGALAALRTLPGDPARQ